MIQYMRAKRGKPLSDWPRSALFTPFDRLGLIIIDEEHESAYQSEIVPRYQAAEVAARRAEMSVPWLFLDRRPLLWRSIRRPGRE